MRKLIIYLNANLLQVRFLSWIIIFGYFCLAFNLSAQQTGLKFSRIYSENSMTVKGLSQNSAMCLMQDTRGFIWNGTWDGLNRFDGYDFIIYNTMNGLSNPTINSVIEDEEGNIWAGTEQGLNIIHHDGTIEQMLNVPDNPNSLSDNIVNHLFQDQKGFIWICTASGLNRYNTSKKIFNSYNFFEKDADSNLTNFITRAREDNQGRIWIGTHRGIHCFDPGKNLFADYKLLEDEHDPEYLRSNYVLDLTFDEAGNLYAATLNGLFIVNPANGVINHLGYSDREGEGLSGKQVNAILVDDKQQVWIGTSTGLDIFDPSTGGITSYKSGVNANNLSNEDIRSVFQDQTGTIWIGTYKGLNRVDRSPSRFLHYQYELDDPNSLSDNIVYAILQPDDENVWIGTYGGINIYNLKEDKFSVIRNSPGKHDKLSSKKIRTLVLDSAGYIWAGTESKGMNRIDPKTGKTEQWRHDPDDSASLAEDNILSTWVDSKGRLWIGTPNRGVNVLEPENNSWKLFSKDMDSPLRLTDNRVIAIYEDRKGNFWLGTNGGISIISANMDSVWYLQHKPDNSNSLSSNRVFSFYEDKDGIMWIGTMGGGLNRYDPVKQSFKIFTEREGLPNNLVYGTLDDQLGNLWISTNWGLSKFNKETGTFINYDTKDGIQGNEFNAGAYCINRKGQMFFGGMNGFNVFHPSEILLNKLPPRIAFTGFRIMNALQRNDIENGAVIKLRYDENFFAIEFSALDYTNPSKNLYRYKLENYDDEWVNANANQRRAEYRKVDPGTYRFLVLGSNNDGVWNTEGISLTLVIRPPWWNTWLFRITMSIFVIAVISGFVYFRIKASRRKHEVERKMLSIEKQVFELEQKALRLQMNPHFMFNSLNAIQNFVLANDTDKAVNYLAKFSHLMRMILANSTASLITLKDELRSLTYYMDLEKLRFDNKFDYVINRDSGIDEEFVEIPPMLFQPFVENAIIHGLVNSPRPGLLEISIARYSKGNLLCTIKDNGIGRERAVEIRNASGIKRQPKGMIITQERIEIFNKQNQKNFSVKITDLKDEKGEPAGTMVEFIIQYKET